jgi:hypothetical protein
VHQGRSTRLPLDEARAISGALQADRDRFRELVTRLDSLLNRAAQLLAGLPERADGAAGLDRCLRTPSAVDAPGESPVSGYEARVKHPRGH